MLASIVLRSSSPIVGLRGLAWIILVGIALYTVLVVAYAAVVLGSHYGRWHDLRLPVLNNSDIGERSHLQRQARHLGRQAGVSEITYTHEQNVAIPPAYSFAILITTKLINQFPEPVKPFWRGDTWHFTTSSKDIPTVRWGYCQAVSNRLFHLFFATDKEKHGIKITNENRLTSGSFQRLCQVRRRINADVGYTGIDHIFEDGVLISAYVKPYAYLLFLEVIHHLFMIRENECPI